MRIALITNVMAVVLFSVLAASYPVYPGYGTQSCAYVMFYFLAAGRKYLSLFCMVLLLMQGKRSLMVSAAFCLVFLFLLNRYRTKLMIPIVIGVAGFALIVLLRLTESFQLYDLPGFSRIKYINPFSSAYDVALGSSGRIDEFLSVWKLFKGNTSAYVSGLGIGFSYEWELSYNEEFTEVKSYLHSTPMMLFIFFGPIFSLVVYRDLSITQQSHAGFDKMRYAKIFLNTA